MTWQSDYRGIPSTAAVRIHRVTRTGQVQVDNEKIMVWYGTRLSVGTVIRRVKHDNEYITGRESMFPHQTVTMQVKGSLGSGK